MDDDELYVRTWILAAREAARVRCSIAFDGPDLSSFRTAAGEVLCCSVFGWLDQLGN